MAEPSSDTLEIPIASEISIQPPPEHPQPPGSPQNNLPPRSATPRTDSPLSVLTSEQPLSPAAIDGFPEPPASSEQPFYITIPHLSEEQKTLYQSNWSELKMPSDVDEFDDDEIDSVVGEYREGRQLYYFVKYSDGIAYKVRTDVYKMFILCMEARCNSL